MRPVTCVIVCLAGLSMAPRAQQAPPPPQATFQSGVDVVQVDVSVLGKDRHPVRGLTTADFTILEDGKPRPIVAFTAVDLPAARPADAGASWMRDVAADAATNDIDGEGRLVVIMFDRTIGPIGADMSAATAQRIAAAAIDQLAPNDLAAVVYSSDRGKPQNFTRDRARLLSAIASPPQGTEQSDDSRALEMRLGLSADPRSGVYVEVPSGDCYCGLCALEAVRNVADALGGAPQRRKSLLFIGRGISINETIKGYSNLKGDCDRRIEEARAAMFRAAALNNLTISTLDPGGLPVASIGASSPVLADGMVDARKAIRRENQASQDSLRVVAEMTGGRAVLNSNDPAEAVPAVFQETSSYYVLGFQSADQARDGRLHKIEVKVDRRGVNVRTRSGFTAPGAVVPVASSAPAPPPNDAMTGLLPKTGLQMGAVAMPFAIPDAPGATVLVALSVGQAKIDPAPTGPEHVEIVTGAFDREGRGPGWVRQTLDVTSVDGPAGTLQYGAVARLDLRPGDYEIRVASEHRHAARTGSVYAYVTVPDFSKEPLSLSGVVLQGGSATLATPHDVFDTLIPIVPTSRREFSRAETVSVFARVYQGGEKAIGPVAARARVQDTAAKPVFQGTATLAPGEFDRDRAAPFRLDLPLQGLPPGEYLLTLDVTLGKNTARRDVRFIVR